MKKSLIALPLIAIARAAFCATSCAPTPAATCYADDCKSCYCLGPENTMVNAPICPRTCDGDFIIDVAGFYWNAQQDGMEYAIETAVVSPPENNADPSLVLALNELVDARYYTPNFKWDWGFKLGVGYCTTCDGWDIGVNWTWYRGKAHDQVELDRDCNRTLLPLWSAYSPGIALINFASRIDTDWNLKLNLVDIELGRNFWTSKYLALRPFVGLRIAYLDQDFDLQYKGGSWLGSTAPVIPAQQDANGKTQLENDYKGLGLRSGLDTTWRLGCGWGIYGNLAASIVYGRFAIDHKEEVRLAQAPFNKTEILSTSYSFRASRPMLDMGLGLEWSSMFCNCKYGLTFRLGWEHHLFFHQNQLWRVIRQGNTPNIFNPIEDEVFEAPIVGAAIETNNGGENVFDQRKGTLATQGWTLSLKLEF